MAIDQDIRDHIFAVLEGREQLPDFKQWFVSSTWDERTPLVAHVDHLLAEAGSVGAEELDALRRVASTIVLGEAAMTTSQSAQTIIERVVFGDAEVTRSQTIRGQMAISGR